MKSRIRARKRNRRLFEDARSLAGYGQEQQQNNNQQQQQNQTNTQGTDNPDEIKITANDVEKMTPGEVINYLYVNTPKNIDPLTKQALLTRADQLRRDADAGKDIETRAKEILRSVGSNIQL